MSNTRIKKALNDQDYDKIILELNKTKKPQNDLNTALCLACHFVNERTENPVSSTRNLKEYETPIKIVNYLIEQKADINGFVQINGRTLTPLGHVLPNKKIGNQLNGYIANLLKLGASFDITGQIWAVSCYTGYSINVTIAAIDAMERSENYHILDLLLAKAMRVNETVPIITDFFPKPLASVIAQYDSAVDPRTAKSEDEKQFEIFKIVYNEYKLSFGEFFLKLASINPFDRFALKKNIKTMDDIRKYANKNQESIVYTICTYSFFNLHKVPEEKAITTPMVALDRIALGPP